MMQRIQRIQKELRRRKLSAALISKPENVRYLCGYVGSNGRLLVTFKKAILITDSRYLRSARKQIPKPVGIFDQKNESELNRLLGRSKILGIEESYITHAQFERVRTYLEGTTLVPISGMVEESRMTKDESEMKIIRKAVSIANQAFEKLAKSIRIGDSEGELEWRLLSFAHDLGADGFSFPPIISFGKNTADVHHTKEPNRLKKGEHVLIDMGIQYKGYMTDMTRVMFAKNQSNSVGDQALVRLRKIYEIALCANQAAIKAVKVGAKFSDIDRVARGIIEKAGYGPNFGHSLGHGVGLEVHEEPSVGERSKAVVRPGMLFTIEPGIYLDDWGGVRIEDMVYVNGKGKVEVLTRTPKSIRSI